MSMGFVKSAYIKENFGGNKMFKKLKDKKGFTLVELIVVLVILAILAALLIPALTGYIDKANDEKVTATTRQIVMAAQTEVSEAYGKASGGKLGGSGDAAVSILGTTVVDTVVPANIATLAEVVSSTTNEGTTTYAFKNGITAATVKWDANGHVTEVKVTQSGRTCTYNGSTYVCTK